jgi:hypothetical protein
MRALTVLSYDCDLAKNSQKTDWLIEMNRMLLQAWKNQSNAGEENVVEQRAMALYFENLKRLLEKTKKPTSGDIPFPQVKAPHPTSSSPTHRLISKGLRRKFTENNKDFIIVDEESGLDSGILPMDITIKEGVENKIIAFIEIDGPDHFITREDGQRVSRRFDQLREELYKFNHPGVPLLRIDVLDNRRKEEHAEELYEKVIATK